MGVTLSTMLAIADPHWLIYSKETVFGGWQVWRIFTSFFHGGQGVSLLMNAYMLFRHVHMLETTTYRGHSAHLGWQLVLCCFGIFLLSMPFSAHTHHDQLVLCLTQLPSLLNPEVRVALFGIIPMRQKHLPYVLVALQLWNRWETGWKVIAPLSIVGLLVGHLWFLLEHTPYLRKQQGNPVLPGIQSGWERVSEPPDWFARQVVGSWTAPVPPGRPSTGPARPLDTPAWRYNRCPSCI